MKTIQQIDAEIEKLKEERQKLEQEEKEKPEEIKWIKIKDKKIEVSRQTYNGKTYAEILKLLKKGESIANYNLLQKLRDDNDYCEKLGLDDCWAFVPNPDKKMGEKGYVAGFYADSDGAGLSCNWNPSCADAGLGVFLVRMKK